MEQKQGNRPTRNSELGTTALHPAWRELIRQCEELGFGEIERLKIQDGIPVLAERVIRRIKLT